MLDRNHMMEYVFVQYLLLELYCAYEGETDMQLVNDQHHDAYLPYYLAVI